MAFPDALPYIVASGALLFVAAIAFVNWINGVEAIYIVKASRTSDGKTQSLYLSDMRDDALMRLEQLRESHKDTHANFRVISVPK